MAGAPKKRPVPAPLESVHLPAPIGGINTTDAGSAMPETDCVYLYNMVAAEYGLRSRLGYREWTTGLFGVADNEVRSKIPFTGSRKNGAGDRLFATTTLGIWDVSASKVITVPWEPSTVYATGARVNNGGNAYVATAGGTSAATGGPTGTGTGVVDGGVTWDRFIPDELLVTFSVHSGDAGRGVSCVCSTPAGRFLLYCDEENGLFVYSENSASWTQVSSGVTQAWTPSTAYAPGNQVVANGNVYSATAMGVSAGIAAPSGTGTGITDNTVTWDYVGPAPANAIGPSLFDQQLGYTADPAAFVFPVVFKNRLWLVERDTSRAWYGDVNAIFGTFTSFDFGSRMRAGGPLVGLYNWSYDAGAGMDTLLVGISGAGDVVIYQGTDPTNAATFGLKGTWSVGGVPAGRRIATDYGGDILIISLLGVLPLSKLVLRAVPIEDRSLYATAKVSNIFSLLAGIRRSLPGWSLHIHPTDNALLVTVPTSPGEATTQLAMAFATKGWSQYRALPMSSCAVWAGDLYFGTPDGRICLNAGYVDGVTLADPSAFTPVQYSLLSAFRNLGNARMKKVEQLRAQVLSETPLPVVEVSARYDFDIGVADDVSGSAGAAGWDVSQWDTEQWADDYLPASIVSGAVGMGRSVAVAVRGQAISRTTLVGTDVLFRLGGLL
jgi:hypothetical protein